MEPIGDHAFVEFYAGVTLKKPEFVRVLLGKLVFEFELPAGVEFTEEMLTSYIFLAKNSPEAGDRISAEEARRVKQSPKKPR